MWEQPWFWLTTAESADGIPFDEARMDATAGGLGRRASCRKLRQKNKAEGLGECEMGKGTSVSANGTRIDGSDDTARMGQRRIAVQQMGPSSPWDRGGHDGRSSEAESRGQSFRFRRRGVASRGQQGQGRESRRTEARPEVSFLGGTRTVPDRIRGGGLYGGARQPAARAFVPGSLLEAGRARRMAKARDEGEGIDVAGCGGRAPAQGG